ncbi:MAG: hypothetical protein BMS9Abin36_0390 [Gammaproteobacteria bacterium]|nr:MAG: hypothetical protein BMS9Abin36_0390 [Gammaproteobacteria bacterium]
MSLFSFWRHKDDNLDFSFLKKGDPATDSRHSVVVLDNSTKRIMLICGLAGITLGLVVMLGWIINSPALIQVLPTLTPMQFNTALGFVFSGIGLLALSLEHVRLRFYAGIALAILSSLTLFQYMTGANLGIDELFLKAYITLHTTHPGRMAPNTGLTFLLIGTTLILSAQRPVIFRYLYFILAMLASMVLVLALISFSGYLLDTRTSYGWGHYTRMALHTSAGFIVIGSCLLTYAWHGIRFNNISSRRHRSLLIVVWLSLAFITLLLWQSINTREAQYIENSLANQNDRFVSNVSARLYQRTHSLERMADRQKDNTYRSLKEWQNDAKAYLDDMKELEAIFILDKGLAVINEYPVKAKWNPAISKRSRDAIGQSALSGQIYVQLDQNKTAHDESFDVYIPISDTRNNYGFIVARLNIARLFSSALTSFLDQRINVSVRRDNHILFHSSTLADENTSVYGSRRILQYENIQWQVNVWPTAEFLRSNESPLTIVVIITGLTLATLFAFMLNFHQIAQYKSQQTEKVNIMLNSEIADRRDVEHQLAQFKRTLDQITDCVFMFFPDTKVYFYVNQGATELTGFSEEELLHMTPDHLFPANETSKFIKHMHTLIATGGGSITFETEQQHSNGHIIPAEVTLQYITFENEPPRLVEIVRDISERKRIERLKDEFVSTVSHELRTPLTSIRGSLGLLSGGAYGDLPENLASLISIANNNAERLLLIINDLLDIQKIESGNMDYHFKDIDVSRLVKKIVEEDMPYAINHGSKIELTENVDADTIIHADMDRLIQVMNNLISNACKFTNNNSMIEIASVLLGNSVRISVTDHGEGIPAEFHSKIFDRFTQYDTSDTRKLSGTGLGLSISKAIIEKHNGYIDFTTELGKGTTFFFEIPVKR